MDTEATIKELEAERTRVKGGGKLGQRGGTKLDQRKYWKKGV